MKKQDCWEERRRLSKNPSHLNYSTKAKGFNKGNTYNKTNGPRMMRRDIEARFIGHLNLISVRFFVAFFLSRLLIVGLQVY